MDGFVASAPAASAKENDSDVRHSMAQTTINTKSCIRQTNIFHMDMDDTVQDAMAEDYTWTVHII